MAGSDDLVANDFTTARASAATGAGDQLDREFSALLGDAAPVKAAAPTPPPEPLGWRILRGAKAAAADVAGGLAPMSVGKEIAGGLLDAVNNIQDLIADATAKLPGGYLQLVNTKGEWEPRIDSHDEGRALQLEQREQRAEGKGHGFTYNLAEPDTNTGNFIRSAISFLAARRAIAGNPTSFAGNVAADFGAGATMSPSSPRLSNLIDQAAPNAVTDFLKAKPEDEGTILGRVKGGLEMAGLGTAVHGALGLLKSLKETLSTTPASLLESAGATPEEAATAASGAKASAGVEPAAVEAGAGAASTEATAAQPKTALDRLLEMESDLPFATEPGAGATGLNTSGAIAAKAQGGVQAAPDASAQRFLALGNPAEDAVTFKPDIAAHAKAADGYLAQEMGEAAAPVSIDAYLRGEAENPVKVNLARIGSPDDIKDALARVSATIPQSAAQSNAATVAAADALGLTPSDFLTGYRGENLNAAQTTAMRFMLDSSASQLVDYAKAAADPAAAPEAKALFTKAFATHRALQQYFENARGEAGRTLQAWSIVSQQRSDASKLIARMVEGAGADNVDLMAERIADLGDPVKASRLVAASFTDSGRDNFMKFYYNVLLSNPRTVVKKLTSDVGMGMWNLATRYAAEKLGDNVAPGETAQLAYGYVSSFRDAVRAAGEGLAKGESQFFQQYQSMDALHGSRMNILADGAPEALPLEQPTRAWTDYLRSALPTSWIGAADDFAKTINYRAELRSLAYRAATASDDPETTMARLMDNTPLDLHKQAVAAALKNTFQEPLSGINAKMQEWVDAASLPIAHTSFELPLGRILMPFVKVPLNIAKWSYQNSPIPLAFPSSEVRAALATGGAQRDLMLARMGLGTGLSLSLSALALGNIITGGGPADPQLQRAWRAAGNEPYSVKIGDKQYSYNMVEPFGLMAGTIADTFTIMRFAKEEDRANLAASLVFGAGKALLNKTYLQGVAEFFNALENPDAHAASYADRLLSPFIAPQGVSGLAQALDPWRRAHYDFLQQVESRLPYVSQGLPPQRTLWGDSIPTREGFLPFGTGTTAANLLSPISVGPTIQPEPIDKWIFDHRMDFPRGPDNKLGLTRPGIVQSFSAGPHISANVELTPEQHDRLQVLAGNGLKDPATGLGAKDMLNALVQGRGPGSMQGQWDRANDGQRALIVQSVVSKFRLAAREQLKQEFPDLQEALNAGWQSRQEALTR